MTSLLLRDSLGKETFPLWALSPPTLIPALESESCCHTVSPEVVMSICILGNTGSLLNWCHMWTWLSEFCYMCRNLHSHVCTHKCISPSPPYPTPFPQFMSKHSPNRQTHHSIFFHCCMHTACILLYRHRHAYQRQQEMVHCIYKGALSWGHVQMCVMCSAKT